MSPAHKCGCQRFSIQRGDNQRRVAGITSYGRPWWSALAVGDPPRRIVTRYLPRFSGGRARADYYALYHMNVATQEQRVAFMDKVQKAMARFGA